MRKREPDQRHVFLKLGVDRSTLNPGDSIWVEEQADISGFKNPRPSEFLQANSAHDHYLGTRLRNVAASRSDP